MATRRNSNGQTWKDHVRPYLKKALSEASRKWIVPKVKEKLCRDLGICVDKRNNLNIEIKKLRDAGAKILKGRK